MGLWTASKPDYIVAKVYSQTYGVDYFFKTHAHVACSDNIRTILPIATSEELELIQYDVKTAFLHGDLSEESFMDQPATYEIPGGKVFSLQKSLYRLQQASCY